MYYVCTQSQKKCTMNSLASPVTKCQGQLDLVKCPLKFGQNLPHKFSDPPRKRVRDFVIPHLAGMRFHDPPLTKRSINQFTLTYDNTNYVFILSCASEVGSPTNQLGSRQRRDMGQGSYSLLTGGRDLTPTGDPPTCGVTQSAKYLDKLNLMINYQKLKKTDRPLDPFY